MPPSHPKCVFNEGHLLLGIKTGSVCSSRLLSAVNFMEAIGM